MSKYSYHGFPMLLLTHYMKLLAVESITAIKHVHPISIPNRAVDAVSAGCLSFYTATSFSWREAHHAVASAPIRSALSPLSSDSWFAAAFRKGPPSCYLVGHVSESSLSFSPASQRSAGKASYLPCCPSGNQPSRSTRRNSVGSTAGAKS